MKYISTWKKIFTLVIFFSLTVLNALTVTKTYPGPTVSVDNVGNYGTTLPSVTFSTSDFYVGATITKVTASIDWTKTDRTCDNPRGGNAYHREISFRLNGNSNNNVILATSDTWSGGVDIGDVNTTFDQSAASIPSGTPVSGTFLPNNGNLNDYIGTDPVGSWSLSAGDDARLDPLCVNAYSISITVDDPLPVTISHAYPQRYGESIEVNFGTATETGNLGFNIYGVKGKEKKWIKLNEELIPGALDSFEPQEYTVSVEIPEGMQFKKMGIAGVDVEGTEDRHGPFKIGKQTGEKAVSTPVNWTKVRKEVKADRKAKKAKRKAIKAAKKETRQTLKDEVVTLKVSEKAVYKVTHDDLIAQEIDLRGFKANKIAVSFKGEGVARHIEGLNKREKWTENSTIEFMGEAPNSKDALYVKENYYRLSLNKELVVESEPIEPLTTTEIVIDQNKKYAYTLPLDDPFYEAFFYTRNAEAIAEYTSIFDMPFTPQEGESKLSIHTAVTTKGTHRMDVTLNGTTIANTTAENRSIWIIDEKIDNGLLQERDNTLTFKLYGESDGLDIVAYDKLVISYDTGEAIASITPTIELNDKIRKKDIRVKKDTNYLMITHPLFMNETLDSYVETREGEGWNIEVVNVEGIYSAYTTGMPLPQAIQTYIDESSQRGVTHVQLVGASNYDNNDYLGYGALSLIPTVYTLTNEYVKYTPSDASYTLGDDNLPTVAIGRWPVHTLEEFENVINKTLNWQSTANALLITDEIDSKGTDFKPQMMKMATKMQSDGYTIQEVHLDDYNTQYPEDAVETARADIQQSMQNASIVSYNGHGASTKWSQKGLLNQDDIANIPNSTSTPIVLPFTCMSTYTDSASITTMPHQLLVAGDNGAVAIYGATVYSSYGDNGAIITKVFNNLSKGQTLGEAIMNSKLELGAGYQDVIRGANLIGDVSLKTK